LTATISRVSLGAAHEGHAELLVTLSYDDGGQSQIPLDPKTCDLLMTRCAAASIDDLVGQDWTHIRDALTESFNGA
jgi:hypothetical protein|tara:strand:+ start:2393 stop:2620 length:228 start_codon:yes stop_codon:yes gene_type:complete